MYNTYANNKNKSKINIVTDLLDQLLNVVYYIVDKSKEGRMGIQIENVFDGIKTKL